MNRVFWKDRKVLITGHTGFKGSWLSLWLQALGAKVIGYSLPPPTNPSLFEITKVSNGTTSIIGDVRDLANLKAIISKQQPEIIIHMAAQSLVRDSYINPVETYSANVMGTVNVLESVRQSDSAKVVIIVTSDKCYENKEWIWAYRENEPLGGHDPYSSSKACAELVTSAYRSSFFLKSDSPSVASVRAGNVIGGGDWANDRLIPDIIRAFIKNIPVTIRMPYAIRPWQYVLEPLRGYLCLAEKLWTEGKKFEGAWNFGPDDNEGKPVSWMVEMLCKLWGNGASWELDSKAQSFEATSLRLDSAKAKKLLGWQSAMDLPLSLKWIAEWYTAFHEKQDMRVYSELEISRYEEKLNN